MSLTYNIQEVQKLEPGWYPGTITAITEKPGRFNSPVVEFSVTVKSGDSHHNLRAFCSAPTSTQSKGYLWYCSITGHKPPKGTCPLGDLVGLPVEVLLDTEVRDEREYNKVTAFRKPANADRTEALFDISEDPFGGDSQ